MSINLKSGTSAHPKKTTAAGKEIQSRISFAMEIANKAVRVNSSRARVEYLSL
jgi:hypothetical protein